MQMDGGRAESALLSREATAARAVGSFGDGARTCSRALLSGYVPE
jgi:hypothetical protein